MSIAPALPIPPKRIPGTRRTSRSGLHPGRPGGHRGAMACFIASAAAIARSTEPKRAEFAGSAIHSVSHRGLPRMNIFTTRSAILASAALLALGLSGGSSQAQQASDMSFFVTSEGPGKGGDLGAGSLALDARTARSSPPQLGAPAARLGTPHLSSAINAAKPGDTVNARDRIGKGPWKNAQGRGHRNQHRRPVQRQGNKISKESGLTEKGTGRQRRGRYAQPARHADRLRHAGPRLPGQRQPHLVQQLDQQPVRRGHGRPRRPEAAMPTPSSSTTGAPRICPVAAPRPTWSLPAATAISTASPPTGDLR